MRSLMSLTRFITLLSLLSLLLHPLLVLANADDTRVLDDSIVFRSSLSVERVRALERAASDIVHGVVARVFVHRPTARSVRAGDARFDYYIAEMRITSTHRGELKEGSLAHIHYFMLAQTGSSSSSSSTGEPQGMRLREGDRVIVHAARDAEGRLAALGANGIEVARPVEREEL